MTVVLKSLTKVEKDGIYGCIVGDTIKIRVVERELEVWQRGGRVLCCGVTGVSLLSPAPTLVMRFIDGTTVTVLSDRGLQLWTVVWAAASAGNALQHCVSFFGDVECSDAAERLQRSSRPLPEEVYGPFGKLAPALDLATKLGRGHRVWSRESSKGGGARDYFVACVEEFWKQNFKSEAELPCAYEVILESQPTRLFLDLEYTYAADVGDVVASSSFDKVQRFLQLLTYFIELNFPLHPGTSYEFIALESLYADKFSMHILFKDVVFRDVHELGRFMTAFVDFLHLQATRDDDMAVMARQCFVGAERNKLIADMGVYSKHRNFRTVYSSKRGKNSPLLPVGGGGGGGGDDDDDDGHGGRDFDIFLSSLVVPRDPPPSSLLLEFQHSSGPAKGRRFVRAPPAGGLGNCSGRRVLDDFVRSIIAPHGGYVRTVLDLGNDRWLFSIAGGYRFCANIGRMHKSNNVMFIGDLRLRKLFQRCYDPDCKTFESQGLDIPGALIENLVNRGEFLPDDVLLQALHDGGL